MSEPISESLRALQRIGADAFGGTALASDVGPTVRRVARRRVARVVGTGLAAVALIATVTVGALGYSGRTVSPGGPTPTPTAAVTPELVSVIIQRGDTGEQIGESLYEAGVIDSVADFVKEALANPADALRIEPGIYTLPKGIDPADAIQALLDRVHRAGPSVTIPEGFTEAQAFERIHDHLDIPIADLEAAAADPEAIGLPPEANGKLEGWLGTYTYYFDPGTTATEALSAMVAATVDNLDRQGVAPADRLRVLTVASLIEREVRLDVDRLKVARVIENRLAAGMPLELDSTVYYAAGAGTDGGVFTSDLDRQVDSPYNTYMVTGLPPGPIASPGAASIDAALHPADGPWLFFVTVNLVTGETLYAETFAEHVQNVAVLQAWIAANGMGDA